MLIIVFTLFSLSSIGQVPDYFGNSPTWSGGFWTSNGGNTAEHHWTYYLGSDSTALGNVYHKVHRRGYIDSILIPGQNNGSYDQFTSVLVRQEGRSIHWIDQFTGSDTVLVNYEYNVGDNVQGTIFDNPFDTIQKIDSVLINGEFRRVIFMDTINGPVITEGVAHQLNPNYFVGDIFFNGWSGLGYDYYIKCYGQNDIAYWDYFGGQGSCILTVGAMELILNPPKTLVKIVDLMGREISPEDNRIMIYIYSDGTVEKVYSTSN